MRIRMLMGGGDRQDPSAAMRGAAESLYKTFDDLEIIGFEDGYKGLIYADYRVMKSSDLSGTLTGGRTIFGTSRQPFKPMCIPDDNGLDKVEVVKHTYKKLRLECLVVLDGNGSQKTVNLLRGGGLNIISPPKTTNNDLRGTDMTSGFQDAVNMVTNAIDYIYTITASRGRVFIVEVMGYKMGWLTLHAGIADGADITLLPEIPYDINVVVNVLRECSRQGKRFSILAAAEGTISKEDVSLTRRELKEKKKIGVVYPSVTYEPGTRIEEMTGQEVRVTVPGYMQRGGGPCPHDRVLSTRLETEVALLIKNKEYGYMVSADNSDIIKVPLEEVTGKLKMADPSYSMIRETKMVGICPGDE